MFIAKCLFPMHMCVCINGFLDGIIFLNFNLMMNHGWISVKFGLTMINGRYSMVRDDFFTFLFFILFW